MPSGRARPSERNQDSLARPKAAMSSKLLEPDKVALKAMVRMSPRRWVTKRVSRGSSRWRKWCRISRRSVALMEFLQGRWLPLQDNTTATQGQEEPLFGAGDQDGVRDF